MCFDKTGTLTEDGLDLYGVRPIKVSGKEPRFHELIMEYGKVPHDFENIMASCHSLTIVGGKIIGDPLEVKMYEATGWNLIEDDKTIVTK
jgi:magnesium-transporting ATPase (P-type)